MERDNKFRLVNPNSLEVLRPYTRYVCACPECGSEDWKLLSKKQLINEVGDIDNLVCSKCNFEIEFVDAKNDSMF